MENGYSFRLALRLYREEEKAFGPGVARLLALVEQKQSLRAAAAQMEMAYSKAWKIVRESERVLGHPLLITAIGGKHGGGAALTPQARELLKRYQAFERQAGEAVAAVFERVFSEKERG